MKRPGLRALCRQAGLKPGQVNSDAITYALGPRLEAAGRLAHAETAYQLLETEHAAEAERLAGELGRLNRECNRLVLETQERALRLARATKEDSPLLFAAAPDFHAGIVGLVASWLVEGFYRPAVVVEVGEWISRGSARSIPEFHITNALDKCADLLIRHGGHSAAATFTIANEHLDELAIRLRRLAAEQLASTELIPALWVDAEVELSQMSWELQRELAQLQPCGYANPLPLFLSRNVRIQSQHAAGSDTAEVQQKILAWGKGLAGLYIPEYRLKQAMIRLQDVVTDYAGMLSTEMDGQQVIVAGMVQRARRHTTKKGDEMAFVTLEDLQGTCDVVVFPRMWSKTKHLWQPEQILVVKGKVDAGRRDTPGLLCEGVRLPDEVAMPVEKESRHLRLRLSDGKSTWDAIAFWQGAWAGKLPDRVDIVYWLEVNEWKGQQRLQLNVQDVRPVGSD